MISVTAAAKINLYLHVGPPRPDGLHDLASLFVFTERGDVITVSASPNLTLEICGPFAPALADLASTQNLVYKAAQLLQSKFAIRDGAKITLVKNLPIASGIGGGSADAAATLRALASLWRIDISDHALGELAFSLGADVPACLSCAPVNVTGAGENLASGPALPPLWCCLVNTGVVMPTGPVFRAFDAASAAPGAPLLASDFAPNYDGVAAMLTATRNDLQSPAIVIAPEIGDVIEFLSAMPGAICARMSGSGATCFGLFSSEAASERAAIKAQAEGHWAMASPLAIS